MNRKQKHVLLLLASHSTKVFDRPRLDLQALYLGTFFDNENWHVYRILEKHHPPEEVIDSADVIIMPGSNLSVNDRNPYIEKLRIAILEALQRKSTTKFLGICFGAQFLTYMFGGSVKRAKSCTQKL
jgi:GMP synthase-like glutamine amidotransferase